MIEIMSSYEGDRALALFYTDCEGCTYLQTAIEEAILRAQQGFGLPIDPDTYTVEHSQGHGVCECKQVGVTVYMAVMSDDRHERDEAAESSGNGYCGVPTVIRIDVTDKWWTRCVVLNPQ